MKHHTHTYFKKFLPRPGALESDLAKSALDTVRDYNGFAVATGEDPTNKDGNYHAGYTIIERWVDKMGPLAFDKHLSDVTVLDAAGAEVAGTTFANDSLLWHLLNGRDRLRLRFPWLDDTTPKALAAKAFEDAAAELGTEFENQDPATWIQQVTRQHYQRLNNEIFEDTGECEAGDCSSDSGRPGDVVDHIFMDRGTYNHVIEYLTRPAGRGLGNSEIKAGSVIPPGQSGFLPPQGQESPHYEDQLSLYVEWRYKPMPMTLEEANAEKESEETITRPLP
jgi:penicillin amidase